MSRKDELKKRHDIQSESRLSFIMDAMKRGNNPILAVEVLNRRDAVGAESERIALEALQECSGFVRSVRMVSDFDDRTKRHDIVIKMRDPEMCEKVFVQVKTSEGGREAWLKEKAGEYDLHDDRLALERKLVECNFMVVVVGKDRSVDERKESVKQQFFEWVEKKKNLIETNCF